MRHLRAGKRLGVTTSHRKAMMRNLVTALLEHGEIRTTLTRAKEMRKYFDKMIGLGKRNNLHARRQALSFIKSKDVVYKLFEEYGPLYKDRQGGYTRIYRLGYRLGDNAQMALIQMLDLEEKVGKSSKAKDTEAIEEIKQELQSEEKESSKEPSEEIKTEAEDKKVPTELAPQENAESEVQEVEDKQEEVTEEAVAEPTEEKKEES